MSSTIGPQLFEATSHAKLYLKFRPTYPASLLDKVISFLSEKCNGPFNVAVDVGCGSGQSSRFLSPYFNEVIGIDVSDAQLQEAKSTSKEINIQYRNGNAEAIPCPDNSVHLVSCAQSAHWFNFDKFCQEANRVLKQQGCIAVYGYGINLPYYPDNNIQTSMQQVYMEIYRGILGSYWDDRRTHIENLYKDFELPYKDSMRDDTLVMKNTMCVDHMLGYIKSWSSYQNYVKEFPYKANFLDDYRKRFLEILQKGSSSEPADKIKFDLIAPVFILLGRKTE